MEAQFLQLKILEVSEKEIYIMKVVILAGGFGTRLSEETHLRPKPMVEIGGKPILWHIMKKYENYISYHKYLGHIFVFFSFFCL